MNEISSIPEFVARSVQKHLQLWESASDSITDLDLRHDSQVNGTGRSRADRLLDELLADVQNNGRSFLGDDRKVKELFSAIFHCKADVILSEPFKNASHEFVKAAKEFDAKIRNRDVYQAIRNLWIGNSIQYLFGKEISSIPPLFAYSMLYPYTDNLLDDPVLNASRKKEFNARFRTRLTGAGVEPFSPVEDKIYRLVELIEDYYPRAQNAIVYDCLMAIQKGQEDSGALSSGRFPDEHTVCRITFEKGGTSVLADGYLVQRHLNRTQADFLMGYGIFLQLIDDLQDIAEDCRQNQTTLFSMHAGRKNLDAIVTRLIGFMFKIIEEATQLMPGKSDFFMMIRNCCLTLTYRSVFKHKSFFSPAFLRFIEHTGGFSEEFYNNQRQKFQTLTRRELTWFWKGLLRQQIVPTQPQI